MSRFQKLSHVIFIFGGENKEKNSYSSVPKISRITIKTILGQPFLGGRILR